jgi:hypothetical protein
MKKTTAWIAVSAILIGGAMALAASGATGAESVMKQCGADWKAAKAAGTTNGQTWQDFLKTCRAQKEGAAAPAAAPAPAPAPAAAPAPAPAPAAAPAPAPAPAAAAPAPAPAPAATPAPKKTAPAKPAVAATGAGQFAAEAEAKAHCPSDTVVWVNTKSHKYHFAGHKSYGATKQGAYMCEADAKAAGNVAAKDEKEGAK